MFMSLGHDEYTMTFSKIQTNVLILLTLVFCSVMVVTKMTNAMENVDKSTSFENDGYVKFHPSSAVNTTRVSQHKINIQDTHPAKRIAYLLTANVSSERTRHSMKTLEIAGFSVVLSLCEVVRAVESGMVWSNKDTFIRIIKHYIQNNSTEWLYLFEDDIDVLTNTSIHDIEQNISESTLFTYLGICAPQTTPSGGRCGRCAHAMGFSYAGAREVLLFNTMNKHKLCTGNIPLDEPYFDVVVEGWCLLKGGFSVAHLELESPQDHRHNGLFFQDRGKFKSIIDN